MEKNKNDLSEPNLEQQRNVIRRINTGRNADAID